MALTLDTTIGAGGVIIVEIITTTPATTASFSTAANVRLVALCSSNGLDTTLTQTHTVSGGGLSWTKEVTSGETSNDQSVMTIHHAYSASALSGITVSLARTSGGTIQDGASMTVVGILGAEVTHGGAENTSSSGSGSATGSVTSTRDGSYILASVADWAAVAVGDPTGSAPAQTELNDHTLAGQYSAAQWRSTNTVSIGTQTMNWSGAARNYRMGVIEIREAVGAAAAAQNLPAYDPVPFIPRGRSM